MFVPADHRLEKGTNFMNGVNKILELSRMKVALGAAAIACGAYEAALRYTLQRK